MNNDDLKKIRGAIKEELKPVKKILDKHTQILGQYSQILDKHAQKLQSIWDQTVKLTEDVAEVQETLTSHTHILKQINTRLDQDNGNIIRLDKRVTTVESQLGIAQPAEFSVIK